MITSLIATLFIIAAAALLITAALSPIETLSWWAGWTEDEIDDEKSEEDAPYEEETERQYVVYLSGIASISGRFLIHREKIFIAGLKEKLPQATVIADVFPYSPKGLHLLAAPRFFDRLWRWIQKIKLEGRQTVLGVLINLRNVFQVMISADHRYGPIYNQGAARVIEASLIKAGYRPGGGALVAIVGYSGGAQIAVGAAAFLHSRLKAPIDVISIGGVMASDPGFHFVRRFHHIYSGGDNVQKLGAVMFPERWAAMAYSEWNIAKHEGRIALHTLPGLAHAGPKGYFGLPKRNGISNNEKTVDIVASILGAAKAQQV